MEQSAPPPNLNPEPTAQPMSLGSRMFNVFATPGEVFDDIRPRPPAISNWLVPALIAVLLGWAGAWVIFSQESIQQQLSEMSEKAIQKQAERMHASPEQAEQMRAAAEKFGGIGQKIGAMTMPLVGAFATPFIWGGFLWLVGNKILKGAFGYMKGVEVVGLASMISVLDGVLRTLLIVVMGNLWAGLHPGILISQFDPQKPLHGILAALSVMTFWLLAVRSVGLARLARTSFGRAAVWVFGIWLAYTGFFMGIGFAVQAIMNRATGQ